MELVAGIILCPHQGERLALCLQFGHMLLLFAHMTKLSNFTGGWKDSVYPILLNSIFTVPSYGITSMILLPIKGMFFNRILSLHL